MNDVLCIDRFINIYRQRIGEGRKYIRVLVSMVYVYYIQRNVWILFFCYTVIWGRNVLNKHKTFQPSDLAGVRWNYRIAC